jgi:hypothetical protein
MSHVMCLPVCFCDARGVGKPDASKPIIPGAEDIWILKHMILCRPEGLLQTTTIIRSILP